jgi:hypothetical protein
MTSVSSKLTFFYSTQLIPNPLLTTSLHGGDKADARWQKKERTSGKKGAIEADVV